MSTATDKHRIAFTLALRAVSPSLSALHASRLRLLHIKERARGLDPDCPPAPPLTTLTCVQCGHAPVSSRVIRSGRRGKANGVKKTSKFMDKKTEQDKNNCKKKGISKGMKGYNPRTGAPLRVLERTCTTCAFVEHTPMPSSAAAALFKSNANSSLPIARRAARSRLGSRGTETVRTSPQERVDTTGNITHSVVSSESPRTTPRPATAPSIPHTPARSRPVDALPPAPAPPPKKRSKKKIGLQELLERNRQRQDAAAREKAAPSGLSSFLDGL